MKKLLLSIAAVALTAFGVFGIAAPTYAGGTCPGGDKEWTTNYSECYDNDIANNNADLMSILNTIINVIIGVVGFIAVVMMILGGISFITSQGDAAKVTKAKNTILYGVVGLVVAMLAFAIVNFVLSNIFK